MAPGGHKVVALDEEGGETGEILTRRELARVRGVLALLERRDVTLERLDELLEDEPHIHQIVDGKKASVWLWTQVGAIAKWIGIVIAAIVAWKGLVGGQKP